ncbi:unnamed protein product [Peronospora destructor]|uniref:ATP-dependent RNA helicase DHX29-like UBA domain-containing protein n=1 Tax=Peronospora destructor TaxID=86335 RepID=A0AAV0V6B3_9STRA|nr:unnamed protein product [Peronospora destructor]
MSFVTPRNDKARITAVPRPKRSRPFACVASYPTLNLVRFCPEQESQTQDEAKHCAALLALKHVEPLRPFERTLPDPYRELWLTLGTSAASTLPSRSKGAKKKTTSAKRKAAKTDETATKIKGNELKTEDLAAGLEKIDREQKKRPVKLTMDRKFASQKEVEAAKLARMQERKKKLRARENRERANVPCQVMISAACREMIEEMLKKLGQVQKKTLPVDEKLDFSEQKQLQAAEFQTKIIQRLKAFGFAQTQIHEALQNCSRDLSVSEDAYMSTIFDWLCLNIPEKELPKKFNPEGIQLDVVLSTSLSGSPESARTAVFVQRLMKFGYDHQDALPMANEFIQESPSMCDEELKALLMVTLLAFLQSYSRMLESILA